MMDPAVKLVWQTALRRQDRLISEITASPFRPDDKLAELNRLERMLCELEFDIRRGIYGEDDDR